MDKSYFLAIDQSTSGTKALVVDFRGRVVAKGAAEHRTSYPHPGWVEQDPLEIYDGVKIAVRAALEDASIDSGGIAAIAITNQRETALIWDRTTGTPIYDAIVWQCQRTADKCAKWKETGYERLIKERTGLKLDPYFSASKWAWILEHAPNARRLLAEGKLLAGTIDSWLVWKLTGGSVHATDYTNASRTSLFDIRALRWDEELCDAFGVPIALLPEPRACDAGFGATEPGELFEHAVPIAAVIGDSQAALLGQRCFKPGMAKATYGTGTSLLVNAGAELPATGDGIVAAVAWGIGGEIAYALEAIIRTTGDALKWVRDELGLFGSFEDLNRLLSLTSDNEGVYLVPAFVGLGAPYWDPDARASITGMSRGTGKAHIVRAAIEAIAYQVRDAAEAIREETGIGLSGLRADGGASNNAILMRFQADMLGYAVAKAEVAELSALGSVFAAGIGTGIWGSLAEIEALADGYIVYEPSMPQVERDRLYAGWKRAVISTKNG